MSRRETYSLKGVMKELLRDKMGVIGLILFIILIIISIYAVVVLPYNKVISLWRGDNNVWIENPKDARPIWIKYFTDRKIPENIVVDSREASYNIIKAITPISGTNMSQYYLEMRFDYYYDEPPSEINLFLYSNFKEKGPTINIYWEKPDGKRMLLAKYQVRNTKDIFYLTINPEVNRHIIEKLRRICNETRGKTVSSENFLFSREDESIFNSDTRSVLKGRYKIYIEGNTYEKNSTLDVRLVIYGRIYGIAGTDDHRRNLLIGLLYGTPIDLSFGILAALITTFTQLIIATISGYYGGKTDSIIQRVTEIYMILPFLPFVIMIAMFYKINIWTLLIVVIILSLFGAGVKSIRALVMQIKEYPYIEAAKAYGASSFRIIFLYIIPKILPPIIPSLIISIPDYVFLEAALSYLGLGDPLLPTWGKIIYNAFDADALYKGYYYWVLEPSFMLVLTAFVFAFIGFALDKIINPRLREI